MSKSQRLTTTFLNNLKSNPASAKSTDYEVNLSAMKDSGLPTGVRCLVGKSGGKRFLLRYTSPVTSKKASIGLGKHPETDLATLRKTAKEYRQQIIEGVDPKLERDNQTTEKTMTLERFFDEVYLPLAKQKRSWKDDVARFRLAKSIHHISIHELTAADIIKVQMEMQNAVTIKGKPYAPASINRVLALLKTINRQAYKLMDAPLIADKVSLLKEDNVRTGYLSESQLKEFIGHALNHEDKSIGAYLALLFLTGARDKELRLRLKSDVNWEEKTLTIPHTKNGSSHVIYLSDYMLDILRSVPHVANNPYLFPGRKKGKPVGQPRHAFKAIKARMGLPDIPGDKANLTLHSARHTVGSLLASQGVSLHDIAKQLNHADLSSTRRYSKLTVGRRREIGSRLSDMVTAKPEIRWE
ncbi:TPA: tyrosine-type recombinase/integrase [Vibrio parahaemolyticus]|uniref:tyrosine-type recombinase/integrase n=1 Tax=Vibrio TaxID=662 RepID=UPI001BD31234|nr:MULTISPECIES: tyrosine-type recombinase/integrase [Vibrio]HBH7898771.1 tyrosine-type recombinase/integrase [Vibrio parahaemolyticus]MBS9934909.1 tyrosine-type recombinase/integrase [Vibrio alginolyticus]MBT0119007.1 tyrosine-type recombinase/integrase [Vibrio alginolyticus]MDW1852769.1 tyrosine-type recombinase/integrase [Vibrio sp. Vb0888]MDW1889784.1 tyrosine-type recombinase/integrase [Vibrio sp. Vb1574]